MLRHWEEIALIVPASIHKNIGYRRYGEDISVESAQS